MTLPLKSITTAKRRGGNDDVGRFKINPIFFVKPDNVRKNGDQINFELNDVRQNKATISAHMFFDELAIEEVHNHYKAEL